VSPSSGTFHQFPPHFSAGLLLVVLVEVQKAAYGFVFLYFSEARRLHARPAIHDTQLFAASGSVNCETHTLTIFV
jgi:hypothetical protein